MMEMRERGEGGARGGEKARRGRRARRMRRGGRGRGPRRTVGGRGRARERDRGNSKNNHNNHNHNNHNHNNYNSKIVILSGQNARVHSLPPRQCSSVCTPRSPAALPGSFRGDPMSQIGNYFRLLALPSSSCSRSQNFETCSSCFASFPVPAAFPERYYVYTQYMCMYENSSCRSNDR